MNDLETKITNARKNRITAGKVLWIAVRTVLVIVGLIAVLFLIVGYVDTELEHPNCENMKGGVIESINERLASNKDGLKALDIYDIEQLTYAENERVTCKAKLMTNLHEDEPINYESFLRNDRWWIKWERTPTESELLRNLFELIGDE